jgi:DNA-binding cell septation regulator SpoVG
MRDDVYLQQRNKRCNYKKSKDEKEILNMKAQITEVKIRPVTANVKDSKLKAFASITLDGEWVIHNLVIREKNTIESGSDPYYVSFPQYAMKDKEDPTGEKKVYKDTVHPIVTGARQEVTEAVLKAYRDYKASL